MTTALILAVYIGAALLIAVTVGVGIVRSRHHIVWKNPGWNIFTGKWSDERGPDDEDGH